MAIMDGFEFDNCHLGPSSEDMACRWLSMKALITSVWLPGEKGTGDGGRGGGERGLFER